MPDVEVAASVWGSQAMAMSPKNKWMSFLDDNFLDYTSQTGAFQVNLLDDPSSQPNAYFWCSLNEEADISVKNSPSRKDIDHQNQHSSRKRLRNESSGRSSSKACREKMRRDRLNDRFLELSSLLEPGKPHKADKMVLLAEALHAFNHLKSEAQQLKESNEKLKEAIKELKAEKSELRNEKQRLKTEKEQLEGQTKAFTMTTHGYLPHPSAFHPAMASFAAESQAAVVKRRSLPRFPAVGLGMWQWMPPAALDTSKDHMLRPPVA